MANTLNEDFTDFILALNQAEVEYVLVGGYAVIYHGYNRTTGDLDIWVNPTPANYKKLQKQSNDHQVEEVGKKLRKLMPFIGQGNKSVQEVSGGEA